MKQLILKYKPYAELARASNLPTCFSNVLTGCAAGSAALQLPWGTAAVVALGIACLYVMGMAMNDLADLEIDRRERPERPLPSGRIAVQDARRFVFVTGLAGLLLLGLAGWHAFAVGTLLLASITGYNLLHKRYGWAALLMGACRGLVYITAAVSAGGADGVRAVLVPVVIVSFYIALVTILARRENLLDTGTRRWLSPVTAAAVPLAFPWHGSLPGALAAITGAAALAWILRSARFYMATPPSPRNAVLGWLSALCLLDALFLSLLGQPAAAAIAIACFAATIRAHLKISGT